MVGKLVVYFAVFLVSYTYGLDGGKATVLYSSYSLLPTINVICVVVASAAQVVVARLSDVFGRMELSVVSVLFYVVGTIIQSQAYDVQIFAGSSVLYQIGYTGIILNVELLYPIYPFSTGISLQRLFPLCYSLSTPGLEETSGATWPPSGLEILEWYWNVGRYTAFPQHPLMVCFIHTQWRPQSRVRWRDSPVSTMC